MVQIVLAACGERQGKKVGDIPLPVPQTGSPSRRAGRSPAPPASQPALPENATALLVLAPSGDDRQGVILDTLSFDVGRGFVS